MNSTIIAAIIGVIGVVLAAVLPLAIKRARRVKGNAPGTIDELVQPVSQSQAFREFSQLLKQAKEVRLAGWSLLHEIGDNRRALRELVEGGKAIRILLLDPDSMTVSILDSVVSELDFRVRRNQGWQKLIPGELAKTDARRTLEILAINGFLASGLDVVHLCNSLLPFSLIMVESEDGTGWLSVRIYPMHPDIPIDRSLTFVAGSKKTELWSVLEEQFDAAWEDKNFSKIAGPRTRGEAPNPAPPTDG